jgi:molybdenum cofactor cytidylyltransferase
MNPLSAIILAAGRSRRMGRFKPLLPLGDTTVVERVVGLYAAAGIEDICVVSGYNGEALHAALAGRPLRCVANRQWAAGMYTSILAGMRSLPHACRAFFVHPVDIPLVRPATVAALVLASARCAMEAVCHPSFDGRRGHPVLVPASLEPALRVWSGDGGLQAFWQSWKGPVREVPVADEAILMDLDTETDYQSLARWSTTADLPSAEACRVLMTGVAKVPEPVWRHCRTVSKVAGVIADALIGAGIDLDGDLVRAAALVHDIAREQPDHAAAGARILTDLGFSRLARPVALHMDLPRNATSVLDETAILFLADKLVEGDRPSSLKIRFDRKMAKYGADPRAGRAIARRRQAAETILATVEKRTGRTVAAILTAIALDDTQPL